MASSFTSAQQHHQHTTQTSITQSSTSSQQQHTLQSNRNGRELKLIASSFVKQYYTLLNKAPCFIHNFYNHDSTFIHGTIEMGSDNHTEPVVGREKIEEKMRELQLNDCRAKIKQIDCLETLAGGLVLQVIGELSNDGKPMRRFLQTFVLAPSPDQTRHDGDSHTQNRANDNRRGVQISENSANSPHNQKFYVSNSIFRYQDDGTDSEFEDDSISVRANTSMADNGAEQVNNDGHNIRIKASVAPQTHAQHQHKAATQVDQPKSYPKSLYVSDAAPNTEQQKRSETKVALSNGTANSDRKNELSEKVSNENGKAGPGDHQLQTTPVPTNNPVEASAAPTAASQVSSTSAPATAPAPAAPITGPAPRPSNEPKTWANMVRSALPSSSATQPNIVASTKEQSSLNQAQNPSQQQQIPHQHHNQQQSAQSQNEQHQQNNTNNNNNNSNSNSNNSSNNNNNNNNNNNRRRHMIRKTSNNKTGNINGAGGGTGAAVGAGNGRTIKNRPPRPTNPAAPVSKPTA